MLENEAELTSVAWLDLRHPVGIASSVEDDVRNEGNLDRSDVSSANRAVLTDLESIGLDNDRTGSHVADLHAHVGVGQRERPLSGAEVEADGRIPVGCTVRCSNDDQDYCREYDCCSSKFKVRQGSTPLYLDNTELLPEKPSGHIRSMYTLQ